MSAEYPTLRPIVGTRDYGYVCEKSSFGFPYRKVFIFVLPFNILNLYWKNKLVLLLCMYVVKASHKAKNYGDDMMTSEAMFVTCLRFYPFYKLAMISLSFCHKCEKFVHSELETTETLNMLRIQGLNQRSF